MKHEMDSTCYCVGHIESRRRHRAASRNKDQLPVTAGQGADPVLQVENNPNGFESGSIPELPEVGAALQTP